MMKANVLFSWLVSSLAFHNAAADEHYRISGISVSPDASVPIRRNINELEAEAGPQWDLYIRALQSLQDRDSDNQTSYFQIAGIHGEPFIEWGNAGPRRGNGWLGYCPHGEPLFLSWHRPYVLLFEQELVRMAQQIATSYPARFREPYINAAATLRAPYWDWALDDAVPESTVPATVVINMPQGDGLAQVSVKNPLQDYTYPQKAVQGQYGRFDNARKTSRCTFNGNSYPESANNNLRSRNLKSNLYAAYVYSSLFSEFSQNANRGVGLEEIHNWIHADAACGQQFSNLATSGFDPLFMLHHANVDRLWAYWQFMKPTAASMSSSYYGASRWDTRQGTVINSKSPLNPFYDGDDVQFTSEAIASIKGFGYTYDGLEYWNSSDSDLQKSAIKLINNLYGNRNTGNNITINNGKIKSDTGPTDSSKALTSGSARQLKNLEYFARIQLDRAQVERPCSVDIYIAGEKAGGLALMTHPDVGIAEGGIVIDNPIAKVFATTDGPHDLAAIEKLVTVNITRPDGTAIPLSTSPSLSLVLEEVEIAPAKSPQELPVPLRMVHHTIPIHSFQLV